MTPEPERAAPTPSEGTRVVVAREARELSDHVAEWEALAASAIEPNVFYEPWMLLPALESLRGASDLLFVLIYGPGPAPAGPPVLCGFFPLERLSRFQGLPIAALRMWRHKHCFLCTPLLRSGHTSAALDRFLGWLRQDSLSAPLFQWSTIPGEGPFRDLLSERLRAQGHRSFELDRYARAFLRRAVDGESYLQASQSGDRRRGLKRKERKLAESGPITYVTLDPAADAHDWVEAFLRIEASGWKGQQGTAMACDPAGGAYFEAIVTEAQRRGRLLFFALHLDGQPIALSCYFRSGSGCFWFKPAFDERFARSSPGLLLETEVTRRLHGYPEIEWADSCTSADNEMMNGLWVDRRTIVATVLATGRGVGGLLVSMLPWLRGLRRRLRGRKDVPAAEAAEERVG